MWLKTLNSCDIAYEKRWAQPSLAQCHGARESMQFESGSYVTSLYIR